MLRQWLLPFCLASQAVCYDLVHDYSGSTFFDKWDFFGNWDNLTLGDVWWLNRNDALSQGLAYVNSAGNAIIKVDNMHDVAFNQKRNSVRITTQESYSVGSLWVIDVLHVPFGCSVWPAFWTMGPNWPEDGEIDIIEAINVMPFNQMALHTTSGCFHPPEEDQYQISATLERDCSLPSGCTVLELQENSYLTGLAAAGGGVWATQFDVAGIFIWFWSRPNVPASIVASSSSSPLDISAWGPPTASFPASHCNITEFFSPQKMVMDITLCGKWAGLPEQYFPTCGSNGPTGTCYTDRVVGPGSNFNDAFFEVKYIRAYTTGSPVPTPNALVSIPPHTAPTKLIASALAPANPTVSPLFFNAATRNTMLGMLPFTVCWVMIMLFI